MLYRIVRTAHQKDVEVRYTLFEFSLIEIFLNGIDASIEQNGRLLTIRGNVLRFCAHLYKNRIESLWLYLTVVWTLLTI